MDRSLLLYDTALGILGVGFGVLADHVHTFNDRALVVDKDLKHFSLLTLALACIDDHRVPFLNMQFY